MQAKACPSTTVRSGKLYEAKHIWHRQGLHNATHQDLTQGNLADILLWHKHILAAKAICHKLICRCPKGRVIMENNPARNSQRLTHLCKAAQGDTDCLIRKNLIESGLYQLLQGVVCSSCLYIISVSKVQPRVSMQVTPSTGVKVTLSVR